MVFNVGKVVDSHLFPLKVEFLCLILDVLLFL